MSAIYEIYKDTEGHFRFWLIAENGRLLLRSKAYDTKRACSNAVASARKNAAAVRHFERRQDEHGKRYFILKAGNNKPLGTSGLFRSTDLMEGAIEIVRKHGPRSPVNDLTANPH